MSSRDRDTKSLQDKLKVFFKKGASAPLPAVNELVVTAELERELRADAAPARRLRALRDLGDRVRLTRIQQGGAERLWALMRDLLDDSCAESRHTALWFLRCIAEGQECAVMRTLLFRYLRESHAQHAAEDAPHRLSLLATLTNGGKNIECFEEQVGEYLLEYMRSVGETGPALAELLALVINVVKYNATYLDEHVVHGIVDASCHLCAYSASAGCVVSALALLEAVVAYSLLPRAALPAFVAALCRTVNLERHCQTSWKLMRSVLGADLGHAALQELAALPAAAAASAHSAAADAGAVRGAVFYINMALWGPRRVPSLRVSLLCVLPALLQAVSTNQPVVTYEVIQAIQSLVTRAPPESLCAAWDVLLAVLAHAHRHDKSLDPPNELIHTRLHALLTSIEQLHEAGQYTGDTNQLLDLIDCSALDRPEASVLRLITLRCSTLSPARADWLAAALALGDKFVRRDPRLGVRTHALTQLLAVVKRHRFLYEEEVVVGVGVPVLGWCAAADAALRAAAARAAAELAVLVSGDAATDLIDLLEKIMNRPFDSEEPSEPDPEPDLTDVTLAVSGLLEVFHAKLLRAPAAHAARACLVLLDHLDHALNHPRHSTQHAPCRKKILDMIFGLRANAFNCVGFCYDGTGSPVYGAAALRIKPLCSPSLLAEPLAARGQHPGPPHQLPGTCILPVGRCARILTLALSREKEWTVLQHVLRALPALLQSRALCVGRRAQDLDLLASTLCGMLSDRSLAFPECLRGQKVLVSELHAAVLPSLGALAPYHAFLEPLTQQRVVRCLLRYGMVLRTPAPYLAALTQFTLEARDTMVKLLPEVLLDLSKVSDTKLIAGPMLEFLSTLTRLPRVFASFVEDQYMSVFAILLPYTNPSRYNHYVVSLAHHVVAAWFLKCRLSYRRNFVRFIIHGLHNYIIMPFEEQLHNYKVHAPANEDSSNRKRSSSLGSRGVSAAPLGSGSGSGAGGSRAGAGAGAGAGAASASAAFHVELTETCVDLLARYTASACSVKPQRSDAAEWMFSGGQSMTWLVGHKLVTITTAGCNMNSIKQGMCDRCLTLCRQHAESAASPLPPLAPLDDHANASASANAKPVPPSDASHAQNHNLQVTNPPEIKRQNSAEYNPIVEALNNFTQRFEKISKEVDTEETWSRAGELAAGACPCWCADWAEIHVRSPSGDVSWLMRVQNQMGWECQESSLQDVVALLAPAPSAPPSSASSGLGDNLASESESRSRSGSSASQAHAQDLHKSSSDSVVAGERRPPHAASHCIGPPQQPQRMSTQPINIPGSPVRGAAPDDDMLFYVPEGKSRHPVRRSNSSPEMSSWKLTRDVPAPPAPTPAPAPAEPAALILLPGTEPTQSQSLHASKKANKKSDMRVSCEAIPEEMSGSSPLAAPVPPPHPHLMTYNSDPGSGSAPEDGPAPQPIQKVASDSIVAPHAHAPPAAHAHAPAPAHAHAHRAPAPAPPPPAAVGSMKERDDLPPLSRSKRSNTISVMSPTRRHRDQSSTMSSSSSGRGSATSASAGAGAGGGVTPSFVLLQLYHKMSTYPITPPVPGEVPSAQNPLAERPLLVSGVQNERTIKNLDRVPPIETYKVGVLYVGPGQQDNEVEVLKNEYGSVRYAEFLGQLGTLVSLAGSGAGLLEGAQQQPLFLNLEQGGKDGKYTYVWHDDIMQVLFHVATAMPVSPADPTCNEKRKYIGNDYVSIVYNDSGGDFPIQTIKGQFNLCIVVVEPCEHGLHRVHIKTKDERIRCKFLPHLEHCAHVVSDHCAATLARQLALHCALASHISQSLSMGGGSQPYASNSLERLRHIKRLRRRVEDERLAQAARAPKPYAPQGDTARRVAMDDFNDYT